MDEINKDITESIKSGEYFKDAREWYAVKYIFPTTQRSFLILVTLTSVFMAFVALKVFFSFLPLREIVPIAIGVKNKVDEVTKLKYIGKKEIESNESLIRYLVVRYIEARENYNYDSVVEGEKLQYIKDSSSRKVFDDYKGYISLDNPDSPVLRYRTHTKRDTEVLDTQVIYDSEQQRLNNFKKFETGAYKVLSKFRTNEYAQDDVKTDVWLANIEVFFESVEYSRDLNKFSPLQFKINKYSVSKLSDKPN